jgi:hypothetical protein
MPKQLKNPSNKAKVKFAVSFHDGSKYDPRYSRVYLFEFSIESSVPKGIF